MWAEFIAELSRSHVKFSVILEYMSVIVYVIFVPYPLNGYHMPSSLCSYWDHTIEMTVIALTRTRRHSAANGRQWPDQTEWLYCCDADHNHINGTPRDYLLTVGRADRFEYFKSRSRATRHHTVHPRFYRMYMGEWRVIANAIEAHLYRVSHWKCSWQSYTCNNTEFVKCIIESLSLMRAVIAESYRRKRR